MIQHHRHHLGLAAALVFLLAAPLATAKGKSGSKARERESMLVGRINDASKQQPLKSKDTREWIEAALIDAVRRAAGKKYTLTTMRDLTSQLEFQHLREQMGCDNQACLAEIAGMTGTKLLLFAKLMQAGETFAFQISLIDQHRSEVVKASMAYRFPWSVAACEQAINGVVSEVFLGREPPPYKPPATAAPAAPGAGSVPAESQAAFNRLTQKMSGFRYRELLADARVVATQDLPDYGTIKMAEYASFCIYQAHFMLKQYAEAVSAAEQHLERFPSGTYTQSVRMGLANVKRMIRQRKRGQGKADAELRRIASQLAEPGIARNPVARRGLEFQRCTTGMTHQQYDLAVRECGAFVERHRQATADDARQYTLLARWNRIQALAELGRFREAHTAAQAFVREEPDFADQVAAETIIASWPQE